MTQSQAEHRIHWLKLLAFIAAAAGCLWLGVVCVTRIYQRVRFESEWQTRIAPITDQGGTVAWWTDFDPDEVSDAGEVAAAVSLRNGDATDADVRYVAATFPEIYGLHLDGTNVTDEGLLCLHGMRSLTRVTLDDTQVTQRGVDDLRAALPDCSIVCRNPLPNESSAPSAK